MTAVPVNERTTVRLVYQMHASKRAAEPERPYLGCSEIGGPCERALWLRFRWANVERIEGRMVRLFDTGNREETRVLDELRALGVQVWDRDETGRQYAVAAVGGHVCGHMDAVALGLVEAPKTPHVVDVKTCNKKKFDELLRDGMARVYPHYVAQAQMYMGLAKLERAMYIYVCKDDDRMHAERLHFDQSAFDALLERARRIVESDEPPARISTDAAYYLCKWCRFHDQCHGSEAPVPTCRSCAHVTPTESGEWYCVLRDDHRTIDEQRAGCEEHRFIPAMLAAWAQMVDAYENTVVYQATHRFVNGAPSDGYSSREIHECADKSVLGDKTTPAGRYTQKLREEFDGRITR